MRALGMGAAIGLAASAAAQNPASPYSDYSPSFSADSSQIVFSSNRGAQDRLYVVGADGTALRQLETGGGDARDRFAVWSPDGSEIIFESDRSGRWEIFAVPVSGGTARQLTFDGAHGPAALSPDGKTMVYRRGFGGWSKLIALDLETGARELLTTHPSDHESPAFSPDGKRLCYSGKRTLDWEIYVLDLATRREQRVTHHPAWDGGARWSPDGEWLAFYSDRNDDYFDIYAIRPDGTGLRSVSPSTDWDLDPDWSPDGKLAWHSRRDGRYSIHLLDPGTGTRTVLTGVENSDFVARVASLGPEVAVQDAGGPRAASVLYHPSELRDLAEAHTGQGDHELAIAIHTANARVHPTHDAPWYGLRRALLAAGKEAPPRKFDFYQRIKRAPRQALLEHRTHRESWPNWPLVNENQLNDLGYRLLEAGRAQDALTVFELNTEAFPGSANTWDSRGEALARLGRVDEATASYRRALALDSDLPSARRWIKQLESRTPPSVGGIDLALLDRARWLDAFAGEWRVERDGIWHATAHFDSMFAGRTIRARIVSPFGEEIAHLTFTYASDAGWRGTWIDAGRFHDALRVTLEGADLVLERQPDNGSTTSERREVWSHATSTKMRWLRQVRAQGGTWQTEETWLLMRSGG